MSIYQSTLDYYVYAYLRKDGTPYYIGKGKGKRAWKKHRYVKTPKDKEQIVICECKLTEIGSLALERRLIKWYGRKDNNTGILRNMTDGGDGSNPSEEIKRKISIANKNSKRTEEQRKNISEGHKGQIVWHKGKTGVYSDETLQKMSDAKKGKEPWNKGEKGLYSEKTLKKMSESHIGKDPWNKGKKDLPKQSSEHRQKISDGVKKYYEDKRKHLRDSDKNCHPE